MININWLIIGIGILMLFGTFATINSANASQFDHDFSLILLIAGVFTILYGTGVIEISVIQDYLGRLSSGEPPPEAE